MVALVIGDIAVVIGIFFVRVNNHLTLLLIDGERLFADDIHAELQSSDDTVMVLPVPGGNDKSVGPGLLKHLIQPGEGRAPRPHIFRSVFQTPGVGIANSHHLYMIRIATNQVSAIHRDAPDSHSQDRKSTRLNSVTWPSRMPSSA